MTNLWILTEERPKLSVVRQILTQYSIEYGANAQFDDEVFGIKPIICDNKFTFQYCVEGATISDIESITIEIVNGSSSFVDYLLVKQKERPIDHSIENVLMVIEETKTSDAESRNTSTYQRMSKFVYINHYCPNAKKYMLYNEEMTSDVAKEPTDTNVFGTNMLLTLGVKFIGKTMNRFKSFNSIDEMIQLKRQMRLPNSTNTPILITKKQNEITVSGRLSKPKNSGKIGHDPNIGALSGIGATLRKLGWDKDIVVTHHGISQDYVNKTGGKNKCLFLFNMLNMKLEGITMPTTVSMPENYWNYSASSEKVASILLHLVCQYSSIHGIYENHAGCERGYFRTSQGEYIALPKKDNNGDNLLLPDVILCDNETRTIYNVEGKQISTLQAGVSEVETYDSIEQEYILHYYPNYTIQRWVTIFGGNFNNVPHEKVLLYVNQNGNVFVNENADENIKQAFRNVGVRC